MQNITVNFDFTTGNEISYYEGLNTDKDFETNCVQFFNMKDRNVTVKCSNGYYVNSQEILSNKPGYCSKEIREAHNLLRLLLGGSFIWQRKDN